jgi:hypothetical protein
MGSGASSSAKPGSAGHTDDEGRGGSADAAATDSDDDFSDDDGSDSEAERRQATAAQRKRTKASAKKVRKPVVRKKVARNVVRDYMRWECPPMYKDGFWRSHLGPLNDLLTKDGRLAKASKEKLLKQRKKRLLKGS